MTVQDSPSFTHVGPGTPAAVWRSHPSWGASEPLSLDGVDRLVVLAAHPDDESLGAGGLVAAATGRGIRVDILCATDGEGSHPMSPTVTPEALAALRVEEGRAAARALGVDDVQRLGLPDGGVAGNEGEVTNRLVAAVGDGRRTVIVAPWRRDGHPDHEAAGRAAAAAARRTGADLWEFPVWFWHWANPDQAPWGLLRPVRLAEAAVTAKARGIAAHASQVAPLSDLEGDETLLSADLLAHFEGDVEHFVRTPAADCPDDALDDLHSQQGDPWGVESRWYERRKRDLVLAVLPRAEFARTLEVGCSTGALAQALAARSRHVVAVDRSPAALRAARRRFQDDPRVTVHDLDVPHEWPRDAMFDLIVVSEVGYFLSPIELDGLVRRIADSLDPDGVLVLCHWRHRVEGWALGADEVHARFATGMHLPELCATYRDRDVEIRVHSPVRGWPDPTR